VQTPADHVVVRVVQSRYRPAAHGVHDHRVRPDEARDVGVADGDGVYDTAGGRQRGGEWPARIAAEDLRVPFDEVGGPGG
jgi:hypothetical protein